MDYRMCIYGPAFQTPPAMVMGQPQYCPPSPPCGVAPLWCGGGVVLYGW